MRGEIIIADDDWAVATVAAGLGEIIDESVPEKKSPNEIKKSRRRRPKILNSEIETTAIDTK